MAYSELGDDGCVKVFMAGGTTLCEQRGSPANQIGVMRLMLLRTDDKASYSGTSHRYYSEKQGYVNSIKLWLELAEA